MSIENNIGLTQCACVEVCDVAHSFRIGNIEKEWVHALEGVSFSVGRGEFVSILGPSGCGKTTLLRMIDGLTLPVKGRILVDGRQVTGPGRDRAVVFQEFGLLPWRTALENVAMGLEFRGVGRREREAVAHAALKKVGLEGFANKRPYQLSGGMRQRVGIARALSIDPDVLLLDEPFGSLDAQTRELMQEDLLDIWFGSRKTVVFITHSIDEAIFLSDRIIVMTARPGRVRADLRVNLPRPRQHNNVRALPDFARLREQAWEILRAEINVPGRLKGGFHDS